MRLSIVIPMYNAGQFIASCLESCARQDIPAEDYEVIVVNDGSVDDGPSVVEGLARVNGWPNIRLLSQPNGGLSVARNSGLREAAGDYVWFVDADDWIEDNCLASLLGEAEGNDILVFGAVDQCPLDGVMTPGEVFSYPSVALRSGREHLAAMSEKLKMCVPFSIFRKAFLQEKGLLFVPGLLHEDAEFMPRAVLAASRVKVSTRTPYRRLVRAGSLSRNNDIARVGALLDVASRLHDHMESGVSDPEFRAPFCSVIANVVNQSFKLYKTFPSGQAELGKDIASRLDGMRWLPDIFLSAKELKYKVEGLLIRIFPGKAVEVYSLLSSLKRVFSHG